MTKLGNAGMLLVMEHVITIIDLAIAIVDKPHHYCCSLSIIYH